MPEVRPVVLVLSMKHDLISQNAVGFLKVIGDLVLESQRNGQ